VWTPSDVVVNQPLRVQRPQDTKHVHVSVGIENVVNHTLGRKRNMTVRTDLAAWQPELDWLLAAIHGKRHSTGIRVRNTRGGLRSKRCIRSH